MKTCELQSTISTYVHNVQHVSEYSNTCAGDKTIRYCVNQFYEILRTDAMGVIIT